LEIGAESVLDVIVVEMQGVKGIKMAEKTTEEL
jgi:hypothetical protein